MNVFTWEHYLLCLYRAQYLWNISKYALQSCRFIYLKIYLRRLFIWVGGASIVFSQLMIFQSDQLNQPAFQMEKIGKILYYIRNDFFYFQLNPSDKNGILKYHPTRDDCLKDFKSPWTCYRHFAWSHALNRRLPVHNSLAVITPIIKCGMKLHIDSPNSTMYPLKVVNGSVISCHT